MLEHACQSRRGDGFTIPGAEPSYAPDLALEPMHVEVSMRFEIEAERAVGSVTTTVECNRSGARSLRLDAVGFLDVLVTAPKAVTWRYDGEGVDITWEEPFAAGERRTVEVSYAVQSPVSGMIFSRPDEAYPDRPLFACSDHETERARYWLCCVDYPTVRPTFDFHLTARSDLTILANGTKVSETENGDGTKTAHWNLDHPCPSYLCCVAAGRFTRFVDEAVGDCPIEYYAAERIPAEDLQRAFGRTPAMMRWLVQRLGVPFPFRKYFQLALPGVGGAMENISLVTWDEVFALDEALAPEIGHRVDSINIHEMAHSYFGDAVVCRHFEHSWLKESWATYVETVWREENLGADEAHYNLHVDAEAYIGEAESKYVRPIVTRTYNSSWDLFDQHLYPGGAWRLHMLRDKVGDEAFWGGTRDYLRTYSGKTAETDDFRRKLEEHSGLNLVPFFDQWLHSKGYPKLKASYKHDAEKGEATLAVEQTQIDEKKGIGLFRFPLTVEYDDDDGSHRITLEIDAARTTANLSPAGKCTQVRIDPDCRALFSLEFNPGDDMLRHSLQKAKDVRSRIRAAGELIKTGKRGNLAAVREAMAAEPFWGVRASVAQALGKSGQAEAIAPLAAWLAEETEPRVKRLLVEACGKMRDARLRQALLDFLGDDQPPYAASGALEALGAQRDARDVDLLIDAAETESIHGLVASGALRGLGANGSPRALDALEPRLEYGAEPEQSRPAAVEGYGLGATRRGRPTRRRVAGRLIDLTREKDWRVQTKAGAALAALGETEAMPALESLKRTLPKQDEPMVERWLASLRKGGPGEESQKLREQLEKLEERCRKLDERVQDLEAKSD